LRRRNARGGLNCKNQTVTGLAAGLTFFKRASHCQCKCTLFYRLGDFFGTVFRRHDALEPERRAIIFSRA
jgi:hypothetical protein